MQRATSFGEGGKGLGLAEEEHEGCKCNEQVGWISNVFFLPSSCSWNMLSSPPGGGVEAWFLLVYEQMRYRETKLLREGCL